MAGLLAAPWFVGATGAATTALAAKGSMDANKARRDAAKNRRKSPLVPDPEEVRRDMRKKAAARLGTGRASTVLSQPSSGSLGPG